MSDDPKQTIVINSIAEYRAARAEIRNLDDVEANDARRDAIEQACERFEVEERARLAADVDARFGRNSGKTFVLFDKYDRYSKRLSVCGPISFDVDNDDVDTFEVLVELAKLLELLNSSWVGTR